MDAHELALLRELGLDAPAHQGASSNSRLGMGVVVLSLGVLLLSIFVSNPNDYKENIGMVYIAAFAAALGIAVAPRGWRTAAIRWGALVGAVPLGLACLSLVESPILKSLIACAALTAIAVPIIFFLRRRRSASLKRAATPPAADESVTPPSCDARANEPPNPGTSGVSPAGPPGKPEDLEQKQSPTQGASLACRPVPDQGNEEEYVRSCLEIAFSEGKEERTFRSDPSLQRVLDPLNSRQYSAAIKEAESLLPRFPDFDLPYKWLASACRSTDKLPRSREVLSQGLAKAKRKSILLTDMGETEWRMGNIHQAVYCWCQALHCLSSNPVDYNAYLLLSYVAKACGLGDVERQLLGQVDAMRGGQIRLDPTIAERLTSLVRNKRNPAMIRAVQSIAEKCLAPS